MLAKLKSWMAMAGVALTFIVGAFFYGRAGGKADASAAQAKVNAKSAKKARGIEDDVQKMGDADVSHDLSKWMRDKR